MQTNNGIHCKISCNAQFRRFLFFGTEFSSLFKHIQQLFALDKEFVLKYKDIEGDLITLSSDEELACALNYSDGTILRLVAAPVGENAPVSQGYDVPAHHFPLARRGCGRRGRRCSRKDMHGGWGNETFEAKLISKRDYFKSLLDEIEKVPEKTPEQQRQVLHLQKKLKKIECRIEGRREKHSAKWAAKAEKRRQKIEKGKAHDGLSEETQTQIALLKSQIDLIKPEMKEVKNQIKAKKAALKEATATGADPQLLLMEIVGLKVTKSLQKKSQVRPLKEKIRELKYGSC